jgi:metal-responsive CopG/Arc/MetJ family transcriptional regulator
MYTALYMASTRTQIYLTREQRAKLDALAKREDKSLAEVIREAVDRYLEEEPRSDRDEILKKTFGISPDFEVPPRSEWNRTFD